MRSLVGHSLGVFLIVRKSLRQHALSSAVTILSIALGTGLVTAVFSMTDQAEAAFTGGPVGFDAVLGARGSELQLVLNTVFHLETSPGNIPWSAYDELRRDKGVALAIPYAVGDSYQGFRIVGTTTELFTDFELVEGRGFEVAPPGRVFRADRREAVVGSVAAGRLGLRPGSEFHPSHGHGEGHRHDEEYVVVGVLEPTGTPSDRVIWIPIEGIFRMTGHLLASGRPAEPGVPIPDDEMELSAVMIRFRSPEAGIRLRQKIARGDSMTLAWPVEKSMVEFFEKIGWLAELLRMIAYLVVLVAAGSILASIYNTMNERRREFAILRALGAGRGTVVSAIVLESSAIAFLGCLVGFAVHLALAGAAAWAIRNEIGVVLEPLAFHPALILAPVGVVLLGALAGIVPAIKAYRTDVAANLQPTS